MSTGIRRRTFLKTMVAAGGLAAPGWPGGAPAVARDLKGSGTLSVFDGGGAWGTAKRIAYFEPFERETGIKVIAQPRGDNGTVRASVLAGAPRYDVAVLSGATTETFAREGLLLPIDYGWFDRADLDAFEPVPAGKFAVPTIYYSLVVAYDAVRFASAPPRTWSDVWDTGRFPGRRALPSGTWGADGGTYETALMADGVEPSKLYPIAWDRAFKSLDRIRPHIVKWWASGAEAVQLIIDRQTTIGSAWNGRVSAAQEQGARVAFSWSQGILQWDAWTVLKGSRNVENAMKFVAFASRPANQARFAEHILYGPTNSRAFRFIPPERAKLLPTTPEARTQQIVQNYDFWNATAADGRPNNRIAVAEWEKWLAGAR